MRTNILLVCLLLLASCASKHVFILGNGHTRASTDTSVYKNRKFFDPALMFRIDTNVIYEELATNYYIGMEKQPEILARNNYSDVNKFYDVYRFYGNGCFSMFHLNRDDSTLNARMFDPDYTGWRGVLYTRNEKIQGDLFTQVGELSCG